MMAATILCSGCAFDGDKADNLTKLSDTTLNLTEMENPPEGYYKTDVWQAVPMAGDDLEEGLAGGEGCQWPLYITMDQVDGSLCFFGTDVGGIYRSTDGGVNWTPVTVGFAACGATGIAIDPNNRNRVLALGVNSATSEANGIYLSENAGETWTQILSVKVGGYRDLRVQIAWDKSSFDEEIGGSKIAYWSRELKDDYNCGAEIHPALYKTEDGGKTWNELPNTSALAGSELAVQPVTGAIYAANDEGLFLSKNGGKGFTKILDGKVSSIDVVASKPDYVFCAKDDGLYYSLNNGGLFESVSGRGYPTKSPQHLKVSPVNVNHMVIHDYQTTTYYTVNGGASWHRSSLGNEESYRWIKNSAIPYNERNSVYAWSPVDENTVLSLGGDFMMRSTDGGKSFIWSNSGYNGMMTGGMLTFNVNHPEWVLNSSQDYNGFYSLDAGKTWNYLEWYMDWGGFTYGGYVINETSFVTAAATVENRWQNFIWTTFDGGKTVNRTEHRVKGKLVGMGVPGDESIIFMGEWRSSDGGKTWSEMNGCDGVFTYDPATGDLYGSNASFVVKSSDNGVTWEEYANVANKISDIAWASNKTVIVASSGKVFHIGEDKKVVRYVNIPAGGVESVAVDYKNPDIIYCASRNGLSQNENAVVRTVDGGKTWVVLTRKVDDGRVGPDGAKEASCIRINPTTGEILVGTACRGAWKMPIPDVK